MVNCCLREAPRIPLPARAATVLIAAGAAGAAGPGTPVVPAVQPHGRAETGSCPAPDESVETDSARVLMQVKSQVRLQAGSGTPAASARSKAAAAPVLPRMQYWNRWDPARLEKGPDKGAPEKFLLFDNDKGGLNNLRIAWEVAATIAYKTGRTLVLPPPQRFYLIDYGPSYFKYPEHGHVSRVEDFLNMEQLRKGGIRVMTAKEFGEKETGHNLTDKDANSFWSSTASSKARIVHGESAHLCELSNWLAEETIIYAKMVNYEDGRLFTCSKWYSLGTVQLKENGFLWTPSLQAMALLHGGFVWSPDVFEMASLIVQDLGLFKYTSLHARYGDFQFKDSTEPASSIIDKWFTSDLGRKLMKNTTGVYVSTDDRTGQVMRAFISRGIKAKSSTDYWKTGDSPIAHLVSQWGAMRVHALKGPVEQVVCAFGRVFIGTDHSTFTGYIHQMRYNADAPETMLIHHTDALNKRIVAQVESATEEWEARDGAAKWAEPPAETGRLELHLDEAKAAPSANFLQELLEADKTSGDESPAATQSVEQGVRAGAWSARWAAVFTAPVLLWVATSPSTGPMTIIGCYVVASIGMNLLNKEAATTFKATFLLVIIQMVFASAVVLLMEFSRMTCSKWKDLLRWSVVPLAFAGMLATSMWAMREASLSAILILKNFLPIISFAAEKALFNTPLSITKSMIFSLFLTFVGTVLYGFADASVTRLGKILVVVNCGFTLMDRLVQTYYLKLSRDFTISVPLCMLLNNTLGIVPILVLAFVSGEVPQWRTVIAQADSSTWLWVVLSSACGACLGYVGLRTQQLVSGTTVLVLQNFNKVLLLAVSAAVLGDSLRPMSWLGCAISIGSCCWYSSLRLPAETKESAAEKK